MNSVTSDAVANALGNTPAITDISTSDFKGKVLFFPSGIKMLCGKLSWTGNEDISSLGSATICYSVHTFNFPSSFNISNLISAQATSIDVNSGVPNASIESLSTTHIEVDDYGYAGTTPSNTRNHQTYIFVVGI